jgi:hypothetical protein
MPGNLHVLIAGVSAYPNLPGLTDPMRESALGMRQLSSPALSAFSLYRWIQQNHEHLPLPLGTCELLLCPSQEELKAEAGLAAVLAGGVSKSCTLKDFLKAADLWRQAAATDPESITWFYFAGHGAQRAVRDAVLLLEDFGEPGGGALRNAVDIGNIFDGMAPSDMYPNIARTQFYFIDACRMRPDQFNRIAHQDTTQVFQVSLNVVDNRRAPICFAAISGEGAAGFRGKKSIFSEILLRCLDGSAGEFDETPEGKVEWHVTSDSITRAMQELLKDWNEQGLNQHFATSGLTHGNPLLRKLDGPPIVDVYIDIDPALARSLATIEVRDVALNQLVARLAHPPGAPYQLRWAAGSYRVQVLMPPDPPYVSPPVYLRTVKPPRCQVIGKVTP